MMQRLTAQLKDELAPYDGRSKALLLAIATQFAPQPNYLDCLILLLGQDQDRLHDGATWLIKHHLEQGAKITATQTQALLSQLEQVTAWVAQLHLCQSLRYLPLTPNQTPPIYQWLTPLLNHKRPFLRAWSLDGLCYLARIDPNLQPQANQALEQAINDPAASVQARARHLHR
jgi:hypothetical protein